MTKHLKISGIQKLSAGRGCSWLWMLLLALALMACTPRNKAPAPDPVSQKLKTMYPGTRFKAIHPSEIAGLYEVVMGENIAYTDQTGRYFLFGHLFDMQTQTDITAQRQQVARKVRFPTRFLKNAIRTVRGEGRRVLAVFSDPDCLYCKQLESELAHLDNVTVYTFLYPMTALHPDAKAKAVGIWCAPHRAKAWHAWMVSGKASNRAVCKHQIAANLRLGARLGIRGTPTLIAADGRVLPGFVSAKQIDQWLNAANTTGAAQTGKRGEVL